MKRQFTATVVGICSTATSSAVVVPPAMVTMDFEPGSKTSKSVNFPLFDAEDARVLGSLYRVHRAVLVTFETAEAPMAAEYSQVGSGCSQCGGGGECPYCKNGHRDERGRCDVCHGSEKCPWCLKSRQSCPSPATTEAPGAIEEHAQPVGEAREKSRRSTTGFIQACVFNGGDSDATLSAATPSAPEAYRRSLVCLCPATSEYDPPCPRHGVVGIGVTPRDALAAQLAPPMVNGRPSCCKPATDVKYNIPRLGRGNEWTVAPGNSEFGFFAARFCPFCGAKLPEVT